VRWKDPAVLSELTQCRFLRFGTPTRVSRSGRKPASGKGGVPEETANRKGEFQLSAHNNIKYCLNGVVAIAALAPAVKLVLDTIFEYRSRKRSILADVYEDEDIWRRNETRATEAKGYVDEIGLPTYDYNIQICKEITIAGKNYKHALRFYDPDSIWTGGAAIYRFRRNHHYKVFSCVMSCMDPSQTTERCRLSAYLDGICAFRYEMFPSDQPQHCIIPLKNAASIQLAMNNSDYCLAEAQFR